MTIGEATSLAVDELSKKDAINENRFSHPDEIGSSLELLTEYFSSSATLDLITPARLRDFLARHYAEQASRATLHNSGSIARDKAAISGREHHEKSAKSEALRPEALIESLRRFFSWADKRSGTSLVAHCSPVLDELKQTLPRAIKITTSLSLALRERGGAFGFTEFLTSFEEGGRSSYDIDAQDKAGAIEGYFRILRIEQSSVEVEDLITEQTVWPIIFPQEVTEHLAEDFIINLELFRAGDGWQIAACGFAYPPGTDW